MNLLQWDRLLETCCRREASDLLIAPGAAPLIRLRDAWRSLATAPVDAEELDRLVVERFTPRPDRDKSEHAFTDFVYQVDGGGSARFRATAIGYPATRLLLVARLPDSPPH